MVFDFDGDLVKTIRLAAIWIITNNVPGSQVFLDCVVNRLRIVRVRHIRDRSSRHICDLFHRCLPVAGGTDDANGPGDGHPKLDVTITKVLTNG